MSTRDETFADLVARAEQAMAERAQLEKQRRKYVKELRAWVATGSLTEDEKKLVKKLTKGFPRSAAAKQPPKTAAAGAS